MEGNYLKTKYKNKTGETKRDDSRDVSIGFYHSQDPAFWIFR
jgi:hypothetical protein